jgi:hypothetical protein
MLTGKDRWTTGLPWALAYGVVMLAIFVAWRSWGFEAWLAPIASPLLAVTLVEATRRPLRRSAP